MRLSTLCYIEKDNQYLMLHRVKKQNDANHEKWIGVGGKFEKDETPEECLLREVREETGLTLIKYQFRGVVTFVSDVYETEYMYLYTASAYEGSLLECDEGELVWIPKTELLKLNLWEGDKIFLKLLQETEDYFNLKLCYQGEKLVETKLNRYPMGTGH